VDNFELDDGAVNVLTKQGGRHAVVVPAGFTDLAFRNSLAVVYTLFMRNGMMPTIDECFEFHKTIPKATFAALFLTDEFKEALSYRGVAFDPTAGLSLEQHMALMKLSDVTDLRSLKVKLDELQIPMPTYQAWLKQPLFAQMLDNQSTLAYSEYLPDIRRNLIGRAVNGDQRAAELIFAKTGEHNPQAQQLQDAKQVVMRVVEAVMMNVRDTDLRQKILDDIKGVTVGFDLAYQREIGRPQ
jgi:hypothetical protein